MKILIFAVAAGACAQQSFACDLCAIYAASEARGELGRGVYAGVAEQFTYFGTVQEDGQRVSNPSGQYMNSSVSQIFAGYNFNDWLGVQLNLPVIYRGYKRPDGMGGIETGSEAGIGDVSLLGTFTPYQQLADDFAFNWNILAGVKFPTGNTDRLAEEFNEVEEPVGPPSGIHGHDLTLGSGSYDGIVGTGIYTRWNRAFLTANTQYAIRSTGDFDYRFANDITWFGGPGYYLALNHDYTLALQVVVSGEHKGTDTFQGETAEDTGVTSVYLGPQIAFTWRSHLSALIGADLPVSIDNTALQTVPNYRIRAVFTWHF
ncbi:MAG TPA: hypothetical protein VFA77_00975 [Candidatus Eisenbacteria bacterium]|nr:hypothetical protein [Candidatus Eisenbacteria bacterium]